MDRRNAAVAGTATGLTALALAGQAWSATAFADTTPPVTPSTTATATPAPGPLTVVLTPDKVQQGGTVKIKASVAQGSITAATATSPVFDTVTLTPSGSTATGNGSIGADAKTGVYTVTVDATGDNGTKLNGTAQLTIVLASPSASPTISASPSPTTTVPKGGVKTGGGATAAGPDVALISAGAAIALLGVATAVVAIRRRRADAGH